MILKCEQETAALELGKQWNADEESQTERFTLRFLNRTQLFFRKIQTWLIERNYNQVKEKIILYYPAKMAHLNKLRSVNL